MHHGGQPPGVDGLAWLCLFPQLTHLFRLTLTPTLLKILFRFKFVGRFSFVNKKSKVLLSYYYRNNSVFVPFLEPFGTFIIISEKCKKVLQHSMLLSFCYIVSYDARHIASCKMFCIPETKCLITIKDWGWWRKEFAIHDPMVADNGVHAYTQTTWSQTRTRSHMFSTTK